MIINSDSEQTVIKNPVAEKKSTINNSDNE